MKGILGYAAIAAILLTGLWTIYYFSQSIPISKDVTTTEGLLVSSEDFNFFILKMLNQSIEFISQRAAYDLALNGGFMKNREVYWNYNYPKISDLRKNLEDAIGSTLPSFYKKFDKIIQLEDAKIIIGEQSPLSASEYFDVTGYANFSIYDETVRSRTFSNFNIDSRAVSSYFKLLWVAREILENQTFNSSLNDVNALLTKLQTEKLPGGRFEGLDFEITALASAPASAPVDPSLVGYWSFDEGSGNAANDLSGNINNGIINGATWINGKYGKALQFNGLNNFVEVPDSPSLHAANNQITVEMWIKKANAQQSVGTLVVKGDIYSDITYGLWVPSVTAGPTEMNSEFMFYNPKNTVSFGNITDTNWHHVAATYDGNNLKSYLDGNLVDTKTTGGSVMPINNYPLQIGAIDMPAAPNPIFDVFNGVIDEVKIYNRSLTALEIKKEYNPPSLNILNVTVIDICYPPNTYCLAPLYPNEPKVKKDQITGELIPYDNLRLNFKIKA
jgi:hypothetical protein